jgi:hypothetical protein
VAILASIFGVLGRFVGKLLTAALGWASSLLFGRVSKDRQILLVLITFGSIAWVVLVVGVFFPDVGAVLLTFVPAADAIEPYVRILMLIGVLVVPLAIGVATLFVQVPAERPTGIEAVKNVLRGYPLAAVLAVILVFLGVVATVRKVRSLVKRWSDAHVAVVVRPGGYEQMTADLERALDDAGLDVAPRPAPGVLAMPGKLLAAVAGKGVRAMVPDRLMQLTGPGLEIILHTSDVSIAGSAVLVTRARAAIASRLLGAPAFLTMTAEAQAIEERLERLVASTPPLEIAERELAAVDRALATLEVEYEEWETLYRIRLQVERDLLAGRRPGQAIPGAPSSRPVELDRPGPPAMESVIAVATIGLVLLDIALAVRERPHRSASGRSH